MEEFLIFLEENRELAEAIFTEYYKEEAILEGEMMIGEEQYGGEDLCDCDPIDLYKKYAYTTGHSASYAGASGVIRELGVLNKYDVEENDEELQWEVLILLNKTI